MADQMIPKRKRPVGITLLALVFLWIGCFGTLAFPLIALSGGITMLFGTLISGWFTSEVLVRAISGLLALIWFLLYVLYAITGFGLWKLKRWGRQSAFIINTAGAGISAVTLPIFVRPPVLILPTIVGTVVPFALISWYLTRPTVRGAFGEIVSEEEGTKAATPRRPYLRKVWIGVGILAVILMFVGSLWYAVATMIRSSDPYKLAITQAEASPCVSASIGKPLEEGWLTTGGIEESTEKGSAKLSIPVRGRGGRGRLVVSAEKRQGNWSISTLSLAMGDREIQIAPTEEPCR
jgi:hypothetical protein